MGVPVAYLANKLIDRLAESDELEYEDADVVRRRLFWQSEPWATRMRVVLALLVAPAFALAGALFEPLQAFAVACLLTALLICVATDLLSYRVPDAVTYPATALTLLAALLLPDADILSSVLAAALAGGGLFLICLIAPRGGFGLGDVKLAVLIGAGLGLPAAYQALFFGMLLGGVVLGLLLLAGVIGRRQAVPYAPFLALSAAAFVLLNGTAFAPL
jgi:leader peptidase (prepilin peptidase)/N-methyltransferase